MKKILIVTPRSPFQGRGADEQDRLSGIEWFIAKGFDTRVVTKTLPSDLEHVERARERLGIPIAAVPYKTSRSLWTLVRRICHPQYWDGAAYEYFDPEMQKVVARECQSFGPDIVWFDYTYLWPLYPVARSAKARIITRSINYEPRHFLDEDGRWPWNYVRAVAKIASERRALRGSDYLLAISPEEERLYKSMGSVPVDTLPLRSLPARLERGPKLVGTGELIHIGFMPSTYTVQHNLAAFRLVVDEVLPRLPADIRSRLRLHVTGNKFPAALRGELPPEVVYEGFVPSSVDFWLGMDIALAPSVFGAGMQQKIFEPLALGLPTVTSARGLVEYPFGCGESVICASTPLEYAEAIARLAQDVGRRRAIGENARKMSEQLFNQQAVDAVIMRALG